MDGIDVSGWQAGIDLSSVPCDFAICKATEGTNYVSDDYYRQIAQLRETGKLYGAYHYVDGSGAEAEADFFVDTVSEIIGSGVLAIDWESGGNGAWGDLDYLGAVIARVIDMTGIVPVLYASAGAYPWEVADEYGCPKWVAQYASNDATGYQDSPWNEGAYDCAIRQYSSQGYLDGYGGALDLNKFYGDTDSWHTMAGGQGQAIKSLEDIPMTAILWYENVGFYLDAGKVKPIPDEGRLAVLKAFYLSVYGQDIPEINLDQNWWDTLHIMYTWDN